MIFPSHISQVLTIKWTTKEFKQHAHTHHIVIIAMLTLCYSIMLYATLILFYYASVLTPQNPVISHVVWLPQVWYYGVWSVYLVIVVTYDFLIRGDLDKLSRILYKHTLSPIKVLNSTKMIPWTTCPLIDRDILWWTIWDGHEMKKTLTFLKEWQFFPRPSSPASKAFFL